MCFVHYELRSGVQISKLAVRVAGIFKSSGRPILRFERPTALLRTACLLLGAISMAFGPAAKGADDVELFERQVRPVLIGTCLRCHGPEKQNGGLRVDSRHALLTGGDSGPAIVPKDVDASRLVTAIRYEHDDLKMPPSAKLPDKDIAAVTEWVRRGAIWPDKSSAAITGRHWAFEPVTPVEPPADPARHPIDKFLNTAMKQHGLTPNGPADKIALIRRATFDLTGLPPSLDEVKEFLADDSSDVFPRVIERLLASKHYGERWGRHWLDIVRYADTAGETADFPAPHAWRYRNYVIDSLNRDKPYDQFLKEQIAGDILAGRQTDDADHRYAELVTATGYLAISRRFGFDILKDQFLTIEDTIDTVGKSVLGMTLACARCHDHKYDPISANDYYGLYGIFESTRYPFPGCEKVKAPSDMVRLMPPSELQRRLSEFDTELKRLEEGNSASLDQIAAAASRPPINVVEGQIENGGSQEFSAGTNSSVLTELAMKSGEMLQLSILPKNGHGADSTLVELDITDVNNPQRHWNVTQQMLAAAMEQAAKPAATDPQSPQADWFLFDLVPRPTLLTEFIQDAEKTKGLFVWRGPADCPSSFVNSNDAGVKFITVTLPAKSFALHTGPQGGVAVAWQCPADMVLSIKGRVSDADATGGDGVAWKLEQRPGFGRELRESKGQLLARNDLRKRREAFEQSIDKAYAVMEGAPHDVQIHKRGDPENRGDAVRRHFPAALGGYEIPADAGSGRLALAEWLTNPRNPLTARVMVNRIWQHHFGVGLVRTPNDFGVRGSLPSHPELLDWLAFRFMNGSTDTVPQVDGNDADIAGDSRSCVPWSIKDMHRTIMLSAAYQRSSLDGTKPVDSNNSTAESDSQDPRMTIDPSNTWLWKFSRRRLSAEEIRDAILVVSGDLDAIPGGPHPFPPESSWGFTQHGPFQAVYEHDKRSVYLMTQRIKRHPFMALFDGADANTSTPDRYSTIVPTQALFFLNDPFVHTKSDHMAGRLMSLPDASTRIERAFRLMFSRPPTEIEQASASRFLTDYASMLTEGTGSEKERKAWAAYARVLISSNEFLFVD